MAIFSSARCPAAFLTVTLQSCDKLRGVSKTRKKRRQGYCCSSADDRPPRSAQTSRESDARPALLPPSSQARRCFPSTSRSSRAPGHRIICSDPRDSLSDGGLSFGSGVLRYIQRAASSPDVDAHARGVRIGHFALDVVGPTKLLSPPPQPRQSPASKICVCPGSSPEFNHGS